MAKGGRVSKKPAGKDVKRKRQLQKRDTTDTIDSEEFVHTFGRSKHPFATYIKCKDCNMIYAPTDQRPAFQCSCGCKRFSSHFGDPDHPSDSE